ncbi:Arginine exporter protein ArgO [Campylobacter majalis]|uniref:Arginine exporter protein ArgO n=1 Tax=Campylobacter majalis TaxID=2790656 RepID=A0ABM8Q294_9BACT|nr:LysE/ArgO family amino acid transporter [Campylobacter majalis]CAD7286866.1 Arginine exporter protein ArgO [Campylobacter majalis]
MYEFLAGFALSFSLILAIGAQNAFVLKQGIKREHVFIVCLLCALSDALLILAGVFGFGYFVSQNPLVLKFALWGGFLFLFAYGIRSLWSAYKHENALIVDNNTPNNLLKTILLTLSFAWLNPHVYLDTMVLIGSVSLKYDSNFAFALGAISASFVFFFTLGYAARVLTPLFKQAKSWKILDTIVGIIMLILAFALIKF